MFLAGWRYGEFLLSLNRQSLVLAGDVVLIIDVEVIEVVIVVLALVDDADLHLNWAQVLEHERLLPLGECLKQPEVYSLTLKSYLRRSDFCFDLNELGLGVGEGHQVFHLSRSCLQCVHLEADLQLDR